jgi:hypothetical protein
MPPVTYASLKADQKCIYQAFTQVQGNKDKPEAMGAFVNGKGIDADDDAAVQALAAKYGLTEVEMFLGKDWNDGTVNLEEGWEYVLTINGQDGMIKDFQKLKKTIVKGADVAALQKKYRNEVGHAVYCKLKKGKHEIETWTDVQKIYKQPGKGFPDKALVVAYGRRRV